MSKKKKFVWTDELVLDFAIVSQRGQYGLYEGAKTIKDKLKIFKMAKSKLLSDKTASVSLSDINKSGGILSAEYHINKLKNKSPYVLKDGKYVEATSHEISKAEYLTKIQAKHINNLLFAQKEIQLEIDRIKGSEKYEIDEKIVDSNLSERAKNVCCNMIVKYKPDHKVTYSNMMLSDVVDVPMSNWKNVRGMGTGTMNEIKKYLIKNGFYLQK